MLRRRVDPAVFTLGELTINYAHRRVTVSARTIELTATEYDLLCVLSQESGRVLSYETLIRKVCDRHKHSNRKLVRAYVKSIRRQLGDDSKRPAYIVTVRGVGYRMLLPGEGNDSSGAG